MSILIFASIILLILGFFKPQASLFWYSKERTTMLSSVIYGGLLVLLIYIIAPSNNQDVITKDVNLPSVASDTFRPKTDSGTIAVSVQADDPVKIEVDRITEKLKAKAERDWPNDYTTQEYWINQELEDYKYMLTIPVGPIKRQAERDWPYDYTTQKFWYDQQVEARERLTNK